MAPKELVTRLQGISLPKWPQMYVWGTPVSQAQAKDIIFRTDTFLCSTHPYGGGNNHQWEMWAHEQLGLTGVLGDSSPAAHVFQNAVFEELHAEMQHVATAYVANRWASSSYVGGPLGWCHPDGTIEFSENVGKWPDATDIFDEWATLAKAFPFLDLTVTVMSAESCEPESQPVFSIRVQDGMALVVETVAPPLGHVPRQLDPMAFIQSLQNSSREQGLPDAWITELGARQKAAIARIVQKVTQELDAGARR